MGNLWNKRFLLSVSNTVSNTLTGLFQLVYGGESVRVGRMNIPVCHARGRPAHNAGKNFRRRVFVDGMTRYRCVTAAIGRRAPRDSGELKRGIIRFVKTGFEHGIVFTGHVFRNFFDDGAKRERT